MTRSRSAALLPAGLLAVLLGGCLHLVPVSWHPLSESCPGPLAPVTSLPADLYVQANYTRVDALGNEEALLLVAERQDEELVLVGLSAVGVHVFTVVQRGEEATVEEHVRPLYPHPPEDVLRDLHRALARGAGPEDAPVEIATPGCEYRAVLSIY